MMEFAYYSGFDILFFTIGASVVLLVARVHFTRLKVSTTLLASLIVGAITFVVGYISGIFPYISYEGIILPRLSEVLHGAVIALLLFPLVTYFRQILAPQSAPDELHSEGVTVPETPSQSEAMPSGHTVFLSYRRADSQDVCGRIYEHLERELGQGVVFKDVDSLKLGVNFKKELASTLEHCKVALVVMGPNWVGGEDGREPRIASERDYVRIEAEAVLRRDIPVIPVFVRGVQIVDVSNLPETLTELDERNGIQIRPDPDFKNDMNRLVTALQKILSD